MTNRDIGGEDRGEAAGLAQPSGQPGPAQALHVAPKEFRRKSRCGGLELGDRTAPTTLPAIWSCNSKISASAPSKRSAQICAPIAGGIDYLTRNAHSVAALTNAAFEHVAHAPFPCRPLHLRRLRYYGANPWPAEGRAGCARPKFIPLRVSGRRWAAPTSARQSFAAFKPWSRRHSDAATS